MRNDTVVETDIQPYHAQVYWDAIFVGALAAIAYQVLFTLLGLALGLSLVNPAQGDTPTKALGVGTVVYWFVTGLISLFAAGWVTGKSAGTNGVLNRLLHGLSMWSLTLILGVGMIACGLGSLAGGGLVLLGGPDAAARLGMHGMRQMKMEQMMNKGEERMGMNGDRMGMNGDRMGMNGDRMATNGDRGNDPSVNRNDQNADRSEGPSAALTPEQKKVAEDTAKATAATALVVFFALLLGALAAAAGGVASLGDLERTRGISPGAYDSRSNRPVVQR